MFVCVCGGGGGVMAGIVLEAYSPLGNPGRPDKEQGEPEVMQDVTIRGIASKHHATPAQVRRVKGLQCSTTTC